jgi:hypothetical protein
MFGTKQRLIVAFVFGCLPLLPLCVFADDQPASTDSTPEAAQAPAPEDTSNMLKGGVQKTAKEALVGLKSVYDADSKLKRSATDLYNECSRHDTQIMDEPEMIGGIVIEIPISFDLGPCLPPRKKWVDIYTAQLGQFQTLLQDELDGLLIPTNKIAEVEPLVKNMSDIAQDSFSRIQQVQKLAVGPRYDNQEIGEQCKLISDDMKQIDELRKKAFHLVKEKATS